MRRLRFLGLCFLGITTTIAVAWALAAFAPIESTAPRTERRDRDPLKGEGEGRIDASAWQAYGLFIGSVGVRYHDDGPSASHTGTDQPRAIIPASLQRTLLPWEFGDLPWPAPEGLSHRSVFAAGWPLLALSTTFDRNFEGTHADAASGFKLNDPAGWLSDSPTFARWLPYGVVWPGFVVDVAVFALAWCCVLRARTIVRLTALRKQTATPWRRVATAALVLTLLGVLISVAIAWALAAWMPLDMLERRECARWREEDRSEGAGYLTVTRFDNWGSLFLDAYAANEGDEPDFAALHWMGYQPEVLVPLPLRPHTLPWTTGHAPWPGPDDNDVRAIDARGWPMLCLWSEYETAVNDKFQVITIPHGAIPISGHDVRKGSFAAPYKLTLPCRPIWTGLLINTTVYAAALAVLWFTPGTIRALIRRQRGLCAGCGYEIRDLPACPECGVAAGALG